MDLCVKGDGQRKGQRGMLGNGETKTNVGEEMYMCVLVLTAYLNVRPSH